MSTLVLMQAATFLIAASIHSGYFLTGHEHREARIAESIIAGVLIVGGLMAMMRPAWARRAALAAQGFALVGTLVGIGTILGGIGPQGRYELVYHFSIVAVLAYGLFIVSKQRAVAF